MVSEDSGLEDRGREFKRSGAEKDKFDNAEFFCSTRWQSFLNV